MKSAETIELSEIKEDSERESEKALSPLEKALYTLGRLSRQLNSASSIVLLITSANLVSTIASIFFSVAVHSDKYDGFRADGKVPINVCVFFSWCFFLAILAILYAYELKRRQGDVLFEEISDELEWQVEDTTRNTTATSRPDIDARIALRSFSRATSLPFVAGKSGAAFYIVLNVLFAFAASYSLLRVS